MVLIQIMKGKQEGPVNNPKPKTNARHFHLHAHFYILKYRMEGGKVKLNSIIQQACTNSSLFPLPFFIFSMSILSPISPQRTYPQNLLKFAFEWGLLTQWDYSVGQRSFYKTWVGEYHKEMSTLVIPIKICMSLLLWLDIWKKGAHIAL